jgi:hypothetical protein
MSLLSDLKATMGIYDGRPDGVYGILGEFTDPGALLHAAEGVRAAGYARYDTHSPFPIHGMDKAMGLGNSKVGFVTLGGGLTGLALATWMQWWMGGIDYPLNISGKPFFAVEPSVPVMFELTILFSAFGAVAGMLAFNGLPRPFNPLFYSERFERASDDGFFLHIAAADKNFDVEQSSRLLRDLGAGYVEVIYDREDVPPEVVPPASAASGAPPVEHIKS